MKNFIGLLFILFLISTESNAQKDSLTADTRPYYGFFGGYNSNTHRAKFTQLPGIPDCCPQYDGGKGTGFAMGGFFEFPFYNNLSTGLRFGYSKLDADFVSFENKPVKIDNKIVNGKMEHSLKTSVSMISVTAYVNYNLFGGFSLYAGPVAGYYHLGLFSLKESIVEPADRGVFVENGKRTRNEREGEIPRMADVYAGLSFGAGYKLPMNSKGSLFIEPEFRYTLGLSDLVNTYNWKISTISAGISFSYTPLASKTSEVRENIYVIDTIIVETDEISSDIIVEGKATVSEEINEASHLKTITETIRRTDTLFTYPVPEFDFSTNSPVFTIDMQYVKESFPLLPFIFFDDNSALLQSKYKTQDISSFNLKSIELNPVSIHTNILDIIGLRLKMHPDSKITLFGSADPITEPDGCGLAGQRSRSIKDYLVNVWGVAPNNILIDKKNDNCTPEPYTQTQNEMGHSENRRVEIFADDARIFDDIINKRLLETGIANPPDLIIKLNLNGNSNDNNSNGNSNNNPKTIAAVKSWLLTIESGGGILYSKQYDGSAKNITMSFAELFDRNSPPPEEIVINLTLTDNKNRTSSKTKTIRIKQDTSKYEVESISLILFDVGSSELGAGSARALGRFVSGITGSPGIKITGYTDILGERQLNIDLADQRAKAVEEFILKLDPALRIISAEGVDDFSLPPGLHSFDSPEERYLSRTVRIEMIKKVE